MSIINCMGFEYIELTIGRIGISGETSWWCISDWIA